MEKGEDKERQKTARRRRDANDRKTLKSVLDKKTLEILEKLRRKGMLKEIYGVVSVGKEACIYLGVASREIGSKMCKKVGEKSKEDIPVAIKIYKTSTMMFKDRDRYIAGERRFKRYARRNSRKLVKLWAEKEVRNLNRLQKAGIPSPQPLFLQRNILVMSMIGEEESVRKEAREIWSEYEEKSEQSSTSAEETGSESESNTSAEETGSESESNTSAEETESESWESSEETESESCTSSELDGESSTSSRKKEEDSSETILESISLTVSEEIAREITRDGREEEMEEEGSRSRDSLSSSETEDSEEDAKEKEMWNNGGLGGIAPNLKHASIKEGEAEEVYRQVVSLIKRIYRECGLVHADLSEYNMLYWKGVVHVIDVGQSVEWDHPNSREFLKKDIENVNRYFTKQGVQTKSSEELFAEVVSQERPNAKAKSAGADAAACRAESSETESVRKESREEKKERKAKVKEDRRKKRETKISKKDKKILSRKARMQKKSRK